MAQKLNINKWLREHAKRSFNVAEFVSMQPTPIVVLKFGAVWCGPCKKIAPLYNDLAKKYAECMTCFDIDVDESPDIVDLLGISTLPSFLFLTVRLSDNGECQKINDLIGADSGALTQRFDTIFHMMQPHQQQQQYNLAIDPQKKVNVDALLNELMEIEHLVLTIQQKIDTLRKQIQQTF